MVTMQDAGIYQISTNYLKSLICFDTCLRLGGYAP